MMCFAVASRAMFVCLPSLQVAQSPGEFFVGDSGASMGNMSFAGTYNGTLIARDVATGSTALVKAWHFKVQHKDTALPSNGPGGAGCMNGAPVDAIDFDGNFTCDCSKTQYAGANCATTIRTESAPAPEDTGSWLVTGVAVGVLVLLFIGTALLYRHRLHAIRMAAFDFRAHLDLLKETGDLDEHDTGVPRELKRKHVTMITKIGSGAFGEVWKAVLDESDSGGVPGYMVAAKTAKDVDGEGADDLRKEATVMSQLEQLPNVVSLVGVVTSGTPLLLLLTFCENGSLLGYLKEHGPTLGTKKKLEMCAGTATGMAYLAQHRFVHRDLAARNVLLDATMTCKIADFGLSRRTAASLEPGEFAGGPGNDERAYYRSSKGTFAVRWSAPEAMESMKFDEATDVWSFGIVMVEVFNDGARPYAALTNPAVILHVQAGKRHVAPSTCPEDVYAVIKSCWEVEPLDRPRFSFLASTLEVLARSQTLDGAPSGVSEHQTSAGPAGVTANKIGYVQDGFKLHDDYDMPSDENLRVVRESQERRQSQASADGTGIAMHDDYDMPSDESVRLANESKTKRLSLASADADHLGEPNAGSAAEKDPQALRKKAVRILTEKLNRAPTDAEVAIEVKALAKEAAETLTPDPGPQPGGPDQEYAQASNEWARLATSGNTASDTDVLMGFSTGQHGLGVHDGGAGEEFAFTTGLLLSAGRQTQVSSGGAIHRQAMDAQHFEVRFIGACVHVSW